MIRKNLIKSLSVIMAAMLAIMTVACGQNTVDTSETAAVTMEAEQEAQTDTLANTMVSASNIASAESSADKVETVYVTADANGAVNDVIVSEWLKNAASSAALDDTTELKNIVNVKGSETFKDNGDGTLTWDAEGSDIYYQGTTDKQLPVTMKITYTLDGKEISPEELAGKSGKVTIKFEYENNSKQTVEVNGKEVEVYTPFAMVSGMMLDADKFANVEISNGKVISDGGKTIVMGVALPGLKESLDISEDKWDKLDDADEIKDRLSNSFEITADTTDFELGMTITMASSDILSDFGMTDLSGSDKLTDLKDDMEELNDGSNKLVDGTKELKDGTTDLRDGVTKLYDGTKELKDGTQDLYDGVVSYTDGVSQVNDGAAKLADGAAAAKNGSGKLVNGMKDADIVDNAQKLADGAKQVSDGVDLVNAKLSSMSSMMEKLGTYQTMLVQVKAAEAYLMGAGSWDANTATGMAIISNGQVSDKATVDQIIAGKNATEPGIPTLVGGISQLNTGISQLDAGMQQLSGGMSTVKTTIESLANYSENELDVDLYELDRDGTVNGIKDSTGGDNQNGNAGGDNQNGNAGGDNQNGNAGGDNQNGNAGGDNQNGNAGGDNQNGNAGGDNQNGNAGGDNQNGNAGGDNQNDNAGGNNQNGNADDLKVFLNLRPGNAGGVGNNDGGVSDEDLLRTSLRKDHADGSVTLTAEEYAALNNKAKKYDELNYDELSTKAGKYDYIHTTLGTLSTKVSGMNDNVTTIAGSVSSIATSVSGMNTKAAPLTQGMTAFGKYYQLLGAAQAADKTLTQALGSLSGLTSGASANGNSMAALKQLSDGAKAVADGNAALASGVSKIYNGAVELDDGLGQLSSGASELSNGTSTLASNNSALVDGAKQLNEGAGELNDGVGELNDGAIKLDDGVKQLFDGITKFDDEGIKKIYEAFDGDLSDFTDRLEAIQEAGSSYKTFGGSSDDVDSSVKFIIKTDSIKNL